MLTPSRSDLLHEAQAAPSAALHGPGARVVRFLAVVCVGGALISSLLLLVQDVEPVLTGSVRHAWLAAGALLLAGIACLGLASAVSADTKDLLMRLSLGAAFTLWGIQQLLPEGNLSVMLGDIVIVLFIVDLAAIIDTALRAPNRTAAHGSDGGGSKDDEAD